MNKRMNLMIVSAGLLLILASSMPLARANNLVNPGFESGPASLTTDIVVLGPPFVTNQWGAEAGNIETGPDNGVTPHSGKYMLAETNSGFTYTSTYQATSVPYFAGEQVSLSAWFNAPAALSGQADADVVVSCYSSVNSYPTLLGSSAASLILSPTPLWQQLTLPSFTVPVGTNYIVSNVGFLNSSMLSSNGVEYPGFVDDANLTVTPEPSTLALFGAGVIGLLGYGWRRRRQAARGKCGLDLVQDELPSGQAGATFPSSRGLTIAAAVACAAILLSTAQLRANVILPSPAPPVYEIAFVSTTGTTATNPNIAAYNSYVTQQANQDATLSALGVSWDAIVSTGGSSGVDADVNAPFNALIPVYNTQGQLVANAGTPLYSGTIINPVFYDQFGNSNTLAAWTGSTSAGLADPAYYMASSSGSTEMGAPVFTNSVWLADFPIGQVAATGVNQLGAIYGLSAPIRTPEPATLSLLGTAVLGFGVVYLRRRRAAKAS